MTNFTVIIPCKGRLQHLKKTLPSLDNLRDKLLFNILVIDYDCPDNTLNWVQENHYDVMVIKVIQQPIFNKCKALNLGIKFCNTQYIICCDADTLIDESVFSFIKKRQSFNNFIIGPQLADLSGFISFPSHIKAEFDEHFIGWGAEDLDFRLNLYKNYNLDFVQINSGLQALQHDDFERVQFYEIKNKNVSYQINLHYIATKYFEKYHELIDCDDSNIQMLLGIN